VLGSGLVALIIGGAFAVLLIAIEDLRTSGRLAVQSREELAAADNLEKTLVDLETGARGFIITGKERFLGPWRVGRAAFPDQSAGLIRLAETPAQKARAGQIAADIGAYIRDYSIPLVQAQRRGDPSVRGVAATQQGKDRVDSLRFKFDRFAEVNRDLLATRQQTADSDAHRATVLTAAGLGGSIILIAAFGTIWAMRAIVRPIRRTSEMAERLAEGDLQVRLPENGPGEVGALERAFNRMGASLEARTAELTASRARIVAAGDETRSRIKRDLHDGAQQSLVHTVITLKLARRALGEDHGEVAALVDEALDHADRANEDLRELAHGILPAILTRGGLRAGVESLTSRVPLPVTVDVPDQRLPPALEATAYFIAAEALTNVVKHAQASRAEVHGAIEDDLFRLEVRDDGVGGAGLVGGSGLLGLRDRTAAAGGELGVESRPGEGTVITATLPVTPTPRDASDSAAAE
jgi:signal transduction histidine kinase